jgi:hypothetical protein
MCSPARLPHHASQILQDFRISSFGSDLSKYIPTWQHGTVWLVLPFGDVVLIRVSFII